jgi:hypothetical protein
MIRTGMWLGQGLSTIRMGMQRLYRTRMRIGRLGTGDNKENDIVLENVQEEVYLL